MKPSIKNQGHHLLQTIFPQYQHSIGSKLSRLLKRKNYNKKHLVFNSAHNPNKFVHKLKH